MADVKRFKVVTEIAEIATLHSRMKERLQQSFSDSKAHKVHSFEGPFTEEVLLRRGSGAGEQILAWSHRMSSHGQRRFMNLFFVTESGSGNVMKLAMQLNFPANNYDRRPAGVFVKDDSEEVFIARRAKFTSGVALRQDQWLREFGARPIEADDGGEIKEFILISSLEASDLVGRLCDFALEARKVADQVGSDAAEKHKVRRADSLRNSLGDITKHTGTTPRLGGE